MLTEFLRKRIGNKIYWARSDESSVYGEVSEIDTDGEHIKVTVVDVMKRGLEGDWTHFTEPVVILVKGELLPDSISGDGILYLVSENPDHNNIEVLTYKHRDRRFS